MRHLIRFLLALFAGLAAWSLLDAERRGHRAGRSRNTAGGPAEDPKELPQCEAVTQSGVRCRRPVEAGSDYCWQHGG
jgi:hypothetical protein